MATIRKLAHIYQRELVGGAARHRRLNYNVVTLDDLDGRGPRAYVEPAAQMVLATGLVGSDIADELRVFDGLPHPGTNFGDS